MRPLGCRLDRMAVQLRMIAITNQDPRTCIGEGQVSRFTGRSASKPPLTPMGRELPPTYEGTDIRDEVPHEKRTESEQELALQNSMFSGVPQLSRKWGDQRKEVAAFTSVFS
jgi:hypothetical protein